MLASRVFPPRLRQKLPFEWSEAIGVLGATFDPLLTFRKHVGGLMRRARIRHNIMSSVAKTNWGLETGILRATHSALLVSLTRYGLATVGTSAYERGLKRVGTRHANLSVRRVLGRFNVNP